MTDHIVDANKLVRAEFEAWAHKTHYNLGVGPNGLYQSGKTSSAWASWQAATQRQRERIAYVEKVADDAIELGNQQAIRIAELEAKVQALSLDAGRYRQIRRGQKWSVIDGIGDQLRGESLDAAIDVGKGEG